jgi:hypothetical protein
MVTNDYEEKKKRENLFLHSIYNYAMGALWLSLGIVSLASKTRHQSENRQPDLVTSIRRGLHYVRIVQIWRGFKKHY